MTIPMADRKEDSSIGRAQSLFNKNIELENKRRKAAQARIPSDPSTWQQMRENYVAIVLEDYAFSEKHDIEYALWQLHYRRIEELRALFNAALASAGSAASQNGKGPVRSGPDRLKKIHTQFKIFLSEATGFYHDLMMKIRAKYGLPLGYYSDDPDSQISLSENGNKSSEVKKGLISCHRCLIYLGDLARYKGLYGEGVSKARDFSAASSYYIQASSFWPSSGNSHHQLAILAGYSNDELVSIYRYFRSLAADNPFITARDNLIIAFEKNRQNHTQLLGDAKATTAKTAPPRNAGKGRVKAEIKSSFKDNRAETSSVGEKASNNLELFKVFITRFIRLNGILFTRTSLETFDEVFSTAKNDLLEYLSSGPEEQFNFGSDAAVCRLAIIRMTAILIFTMHNVNKENENKSYADILQRSVLLQNASIAAFEIMGCIMECCSQLNDPSSSYLLPGIMVFVEWLACCHDVAVGSELEEKQVNARSFFWNKFISLLNKLLSSGYSFVNDEDEDACFSNMSKYDENETANRLALPEDSELRGFLPLAPAQLILDFSRKHSFGGDGGKKEKIARVQRFIAAGKALANIVRIGREGVYFDPKVKKFVIGMEPQISEDYLPNSFSEPNLYGGSSDILIGQEVFLAAAPKPELEMDAEDDDELILFKPSTNEKHMNDVSSKLTSPVISSSVDGAGKFDFVNENGSFSVGHDSLLLQSALSASMRPSTTVVSGISESLPSLQPSMSNWPAEQPPIVSGLAHLSLMGNGSLLRSELQDQFGVSQNAALSVPYPNFVNGGAGHNFTSRIAQVAMPPKFDFNRFSGAAGDSPSIKPSAVVPPSSKKNPVSRPVRHTGPPPGFGAVPSKFVDESLNVSLKNENPPTPQMDKYSWLNGHHLSSLNQSAGFSNAISQVAPAFDTVSKNFGSMGIASFPFPGKQFSTLQFQNENQKGWEDQKKMYEEQQQQQQFQKANQQPVGPPQQYQGQSLFEGRFFV